MSLLRQYLRNETIDKVSDWVCMTDSLKCVLGVEQVVFQIKNKTLLDILRLEGTKYFMLEREDNLFIKVLCPSKLKMILWSEDGEIFTLYNLKVAKFQYQLEEKSNNWYCNL